MTTHLDWMLAPVVEVVLYGQDDPVVTWHAKADAYVPRLGEKLTLPEGRFRVLDVDHELFPSTNQYWHPVIKLWVERVR